MNSYVDQKFVNSYKATVGADFMEKEVIVDGKVINLEVSLNTTFRYGTLPVRKSSGVWVGLFIVGQIVVFWSMI